MAGLYNLDAEFVTEDPKGDILGKFSVKPLVTDPELIDLAVTSAQEILKRRRRPLLGATEALTIMYESLHEVAIRCAKIMQAAPRIDYVYLEKHYPLTSYKREFRDLKDDFYFDPRYLAKDLCLVHCYQYTHNCLYQTLPLRNWSPQWKEYWKGFPHEEIRSLSSRSGIQLNAEDRYDKWARGSEEETEAFYLNTKNPFVYTLTKYNLGRL